MPDSRKFTIGLFRETCKCKSYHAVYDLELRDLGGEGCKI